MSGLFASELSSKLHQTSVNVTMMLALTINNRISKMMMIQLYTGLRQFDFMPAQQQNGGLGAHFSCSPAPVWLGHCSPRTTMAVAGVAKVSRPSLDIPRTMGRRHCSSV